MKYCVDCKWFVPGKKRRLHLCAHNEAGDLIAGKRTDLGGSRKTCEDMRLGVFIARELFPGRCGLDGHLWEQKGTPA